MNLNENDSCTMSSSRLMVDKKRLNRITSSIFSMFQNVSIENVAIYIYGGRDALV